MRTIVITRYAFGYWGTTLVSALNILTQVRSHYFPIVLILTDAYVYHLALYFTCTVLHGAFRDCLNPVLSNTISREAWLFSDFSDSRRPNFSQNKSKYSTCRRSGSHRVRAIVH